MAGKPLAERLEVKGNRTIAVVAAPAEVDALIGLRYRRAAVEDADVILLFVGERSDLQTALGHLQASARGAAILWIAYPKLTSVLAKDLSRDIVRETAPDFGLDTVSQIAIDRDWSALRVKRMVATA